MLDSQEADSDYLQKVYDKFFWDPHLWGKGRKETGLGRGMQCSHSKALVNWTEGSAAVVWYPSMAFSWGEGLDLHSSEL